MNKNKKDQNELEKYNAALKTGLRNGLQFTRLLDRAQTAVSSNVLLEAIKRLSHYHLNTPLVYFPYQYQPADYYLVFMDRLLAQHHDNSQISLISKHRKLFQKIKPVGTFDTFYFVKRDDGGMKYKDSRFQEDLFDLDLDNKTLHFNSLALTTVFLVHYLRHLSAEQIRATVGVLIKFGRNLQKDYGFQVDFSILDDDNDKFYHFKKPQLRHDLLDELFISSAEHKYMLKSYLNYGAQLCLPDNLRINIFAATQNGHDWGVEVRDRRNELSWFDIVLGYDFIRSWYLKNLSQLVLL